MAASAIDAQLDTPTAVAVDSAGNLYIADTFNSMGTITTVAGNGTQDYTGDGIAALNYPTNLAVDVAGNIYISDRANSVVSAR